MLLMSCVRLSVCLCVCLSLSLFVCVTQLHGPAYTAEGVPFPVDTLVQQCLRGAVPACASCAESLVVSRTLLLHHIGFNVSTTHRNYGRHTWQCGWRQPFNGDADVTVL
jgi:hypothetical protein